MADDYRAIHQLWTQGNYMEALEEIWQIQDELLTFPSFQAAASIENLDLRDLVFRACQQAATISWTNTFEREQARQWVEQRLKAFPPPPVLIEHGDLGLAEAVSDAETYRIEMIHAHLLCTLAVLQGEWTSGTVPSGKAMFAKELSAIAEATDVPLSFFYNLMQELLPEEVKTRQLHPARPTLSLTTLLVREGREEGVVATLTLELLPNGTGTLYPSPDLAFVRRDPSFRDAEKNARTYVESLGLWRKDRDVCWRLERRDRQSILALGGPSLGLAFATGMAKLLVTE